MLGFLYYKGVFDSFVKTVRVKLGNPSFNSAETRAAWFTKVFINVPLTVVNSTSLDAMVNGVKLNAVYSGQVVATISKTGGAQIAPNSSATFNMLVGIPVSSIPNLLNLVSGGVASGNFKMNVVGTVDTTAGIINVNETVSV